MPHPFKVVQTPSLVVLLYETSTNQTYHSVERQASRRSGSRLYGRFGGHWEGTRSWWT
jgi:hypothetical protein